MTWPVMPLSNLVDVMHQGINTAADKVEYSQSGYPIIQSKHLKENCVDFDGVKYLSESDFQKYSPKYVPQKGDILFANIGSIGKSLIIDTGSTFLFAWNVFLIRPKQELIDVSYLKYFFDRLLSIKYYDQYLTGGTVKFVNKKVMGEIEIPLPPLEEQKRIAAILDKADAIRRKRQQAIDLADDFLRSVFLDMFGDPVINPKGWEVKSLGSLIESGPTNGLYKPSTEYGSGIRILRIDGFYNGVLSPQEKLKRVNLGQNEIEKYQLKDRSILINRVNSRDYLGKSAFVERLEEVTVFESNMMNFSANEKIINPCFLVHQLQTPYVKNQVLKLAKDAVNQSSINQQDVKSLEVIVPNLELQTEFELVCTRYKDSLTTRKESIFNCEAIFSSLGQRAFSGQL
ncbi:EcoKI restriction-modification system protein HsdS [Marinomonas spartinae]|uniref:EcoKI restriction-modification system protein HsdS n=1 Tax=Marinomonas spartinae TaxID=1792290 RepID=A0A1A8TKH1_9GAMM|nr:restriction endonuclease subunit S [Marinomonas spartinae]SBS34034.1 EcoKI restriction-modification system protein HsdS [Marinomonas spartinae]